MDETAVELAFAVFPDFVFVKKYWKFAEPGFKYIDSGMLTVIS